MSAGPTTGIDDATAVEVCSRFPLGDEAKALLTDAITPEAFLNVLMKQELFIDGVRLLAHALPKREGVWWACLCARATLDPEPEPSIMLALEAATEWVVDPSEENRRRAMPAAEAASMGTPAGCAAMAAYWSGGSLAPENLPVVPPGETLTAHGVAGAVMLAAVRKQPEKAPEKYRKFLSRGVAIGHGSERWEEKGVKDQEAAPAPKGPARSAIKTPGGSLNWD